MGNIFTSKEPNVLLPKDDDKFDTREKNLKNAREKYQLEQKTHMFLDVEQRSMDDVILNLPPMLRKLPEEEKRSFFTEIRILVHFLLYRLYCVFHQHLKWRIDRLIHYIISFFLLKRPTPSADYNRWTIARMISHFQWSFVLKEPKGCKVWRKEAVDMRNQTSSQIAQADHWFAWQRINGVTRNLIKRVDDVPQQFLPFATEIGKNHPYLSSQSLQDQIQQNNVYIVDLTEISLKDPKLLAPVALFTVYGNLLMPVAVWLNTKTHDDGEVHKPPPQGEKYGLRLRKWVKIRMLFNMLEAQYHESITHLGFTHMLMDGVSVCMHRNLSDRHPIYKLLSPHFHYMHGINRDAQEVLISPGGYLDGVMYLRRDNMLNLISKHNEIWTFTTHASIPRSFETRGAMNIPGYFFKDDALILHEAIRKYVSEYTNHYYEKNDENVENDSEIQAFRHELTLERKIDGSGGCGMQVFPSFNTVQNLVDVLTTFIYICSVEHSATNFPQFDQYAFPPNFAAKLHCHPEQEEGNLDDIMPTRNETFSTIAIMKILTLRLTNSIGNYENHYLQAMDSNGRAFVQKFQQNLITIKDCINQRNNKILEDNKDDTCKPLLKEYPYEWLNPDNVLNSISI